MPPIDTDAFSDRLRSKAIDIENKRILITRFSGSEQEKDLSDPPNCDGFGRIRHFKRQTSSNWPENPLPIDPAASKLRLGAPSEVRAQVFQNSACNWRCWYCYVPFDLLGADPKKGNWLTAREMIDLYKKSASPSSIIDLSGGQPDLTPEWIPWTMEALREQGLESSTYLWSDDNLSNDYFWKYLTPVMIETVRNYVNYGKVGCFKGFDSASFAFNTGAPGELFQRQFDLFRRSLELGIDVYAYVTFTSPANDDIAGAMKSFVDALQELHENLPLRTVPLEIKMFSPVHRRLQTNHEKSIHIQNQAITCWKEEIDRRFSSQERSKPIFEVSLR